LAVLFIVCVVYILLDLELGGEVHVVWIYASWGCAESWVAIFFCPFVANAGEEGGMSWFYFLIIRFDDSLVIEIILDSISQDQQIGINSFKLSIWKTYIFPHLFFLFDLFFIIFFPKNNLKNT
jgi:hypothetical protein